jgi:hypothetical protein
VKCTSEVSLVGHRNFTARCSMSLCMSLSLHEFVDEGALPDFIYACSGKYLSYKD